MSAGVRISVALGTRDRPESLRRCLASLRAQDEQPWEVVVADDSHDPSAAKNLAAEFGAVWMAGPRRGLYANRNAAALACQGTHIRTMDDDHTFPAGHFRSCGEALRSDPAAIWTTGESSFLGERQHSFTARAGQLHPSGVAGPVSDPDDNWAIADGSTIYPREVFDRGFRYVEEFGFGSSYLEFGALLYARGWRSRCVPGAIVEHRLDPETLVRQFRKSVLYASFCYNLRFRPNVPRALRHAASSLVRQPSLLTSVPRLLARMRERWDA